jgi:hypothetical protein
VVAAGNPAQQPVLVPPLPGSEPGRTAPGSPSSCWPPPRSPART